MNHVPDAVIEAIDRLGEQLLAGVPAPVAKTIQDDLALRVDPDVSRGSALCRYDTGHTRTPRTLRARGPFVTTVIDGIDDRFRRWGIEPPEAYTYTETVGGVHRYEGTLRLP